MPERSDINGQLWGVCFWCRMHIWKYPNGQIWRDANMNSVCVRSPQHWHVREY